MTLENNRKRWLALIVLCLGELMIVLDTTSASVIGALWSAAMFAWFFISALYMQLVLGYSAMQVGLAFLPADLIMAAFSLGISARTGTLAAPGAAMPVALTGGYQLAFVFGALFAGVAALLSAVLLRTPRLSPSYKGA